MGYDTQPIALRKGTERAGIAFGTEKRLTESLSLEKILSLRKKWPFRNIQ